MSEKIKDAASSFAAKLDRFRSFLNVVEGRESLRDKLSWLYNPKDIRTASRFTTSQVDFQTDVRTAREMYPEFESLKLLAENQGFVMISHKGLGREEGIKSIERQRAQSPLAILQNLTSPQEKSSKQSKSAETDKK